VGGYGTIHCSETRCGCALRTRARPWRRWPAYQWLGPERVGGNALWAAPYGRLTEVCLVVRTPDIRCIERNLLKGMITVP
jgi:hypothetical protein